MNTTTAPERVITREMLEDRWKGAILSDDARATRRYLRLVGMLDDLIGDVTRCYGDGYWEGAADRGEPTPSGIVDEVINLTRETIISRVHELGIAR